MMKTHYGLVLGFLTAVGCASNAANDGSPPSSKPPACDATPNGECSCTADAFIACVGETAVTCNAKGDGITTQSCAAGCNKDAGRCNECEANRDSCVDATTLAHCGPDGLFTQTESCAAGCFSDITSTHCMSIEPAWMPDVCDTPAAIVSAAFINPLDTDNDASCTGGVAVKSGATFCLVRARTIDIGSLKVVGTRPIAFIADDKLTVTGTLDLSADGATSGPGASTIGQGTSSIGASYLGAGGAGFAQTGGAGGASDTGSAGASGGVMTERRTTDVFRGGARGGDSRCDNGSAFCFNGVDFSGGGGGGGAVLIACRGTVKVTGMIDASGGGGRGGGDHYSSTSIAQGGAPGGGSGGFVALQGVRVEITGELYANGGGGGAGCTGDNCVGQPGSDGLRSTNSASGGAGPVPTGKCSGGAGGSATGAPGAGQQTYSNGAAGAGGGGGSMGAFAVYTPASGSTLLTPQQASPMPEASTTKLDVH